MSPAPNVAFLFHEEAWNCMPRPKVKVVGKPLYTDMEITAPRIRAETITPTLVYCD